MDASVLPTNLGVNPQHTIMAVIYGATERLANAELRERRAA
jgi:choline dehydrogenase-like flavoprotein